MKFALIGMSGIGKSYWAKRLEQAGWARFDCDAMIAQRLDELIELRGGEDAVIAVGRWMGMPWTPGYAEREQQYLDLERQVTNDALDQAAALPADTNAVIDTTGSVIYTGKELLDRLKSECRVVYLDAPEHVRETMVKLYCDQPKPVLWQGAFVPNEHESQGVALSRCYARLLTERTERYRSLADRVLDYGVLREPGIDHDRVAAMMKR